MLNVNKKNKLKFFFFLNLSINTQAIKRNIILCGHTLNCKQCVHVKLIVCIF